VYASARMLNGFLVIWSRSLTGPAAARCILLRHGKHLIWRQPRSTAKTVRQINFEITGCVRLCRTVRY